MQKEISQHIVIRRMQNEDLNTLARIEAEIAIDPWNKQLFNSCSEIYDTFVAFVNNEVIGFGVIAIYSSINEAHILNLGVSKAWQGKGVGGEILKYLINVFIKFNNNFDNIKNIAQIEQKKIFLEVNKNNKNAINLYKKFNFTEVGVRENYYKTKDGMEDALIYLLVIKFLG